MPQGPSLTSSLNPSEMLKPCQPQYILSPFPYCPFLLPLLPKGPSWVDSPCSGLPVPAPQKCNMDGMARKPCTNPAQTRESFSLGSALHFICREATPHARTPSAEHRHIVSTWALLRKLLPRAKRMLPPATASKHIN